MPLPTVPYRPRPVPIEEVQRRLFAELEVAATRRSVRHFSTAPVPRAAIEAAIRIAGTAPNGAHRQPWHFVALSDPDLKRRVRVAAEEEERRFYEEKASESWLRALEPLGTDAIKTHLTDAPWLVVVFKRDWEERLGQREANYYVSESVGIAVGFFLAALHRAGLCALTHTPSPMTFLREICERPINEKPYVLIPVGYSATDCEVPDLHRKELVEISTFR